METERRRRRTSCTTTTDLVFIDTNVFLYAKDERVPEKQTRARNWLAALTARGSIVISPQVLSEIYNVVLRSKVPADAEEVRRETLVLERWSRGTIDLELVAVAWTIRAETGFQWWDCLILGSAIRSGSRYLLSEDYQHGRTVRGTTIINPFMIGLEAIATEH